MHLYSEARHIAQEAWEESEGDYDTAIDYIHESCDGHQVAIYYGKAISFCAEQDTSEGEDFLEGCDSLVLPGQSFGQTACRIAFATLYCAAVDALNDIVKESEG